MRKIYFFLFVLFSASFSFAQNCPLTDKPDVNFLDENGDGIDGDTNNAVFVSDLTGNDANPGTMSAPLKSLTMAMAKAHAVSKDIYMAAGTYTIYAPLIIFDGIGIYGYFSSTTWNRNKFNKVIIQGTSNVIYAKGNTKNSTLQGLEIIASNATGFGNSSCAVWVDSCAGTFLFIDNVIKAGKGSAGANGANGVVGASGGDGGNGTAGMCDGNTAGVGGAAGFSSCAPGGKGGNGGVSTQNGFIGSSNSAGTLGGGGGLSGDPGKAGNNGVNGSNGSSGVSASSNNLIHDIGVNGIKGGKGLDGTDGSNGVSGSGGGGGGGQHCSFCNDGSGNGGGGGGGAGCKGFGGKGGNGGGSSIAFFVRDSRVYLENNKITTQAGGNGGNGGDGGKGGDGGIGGSGATNCFAEVGAGGNGGDGGDGGNAGAGSGGNGGSSLGLIAIGSADVYHSGNVFTLGATGMGGNGGAAINLPNGAIGFNGVSKNIEGSSTNDVASVQSELCVEDVTVVRYQNSLKDAVAIVTLSEPNPKEVRVSFSFSNGTAVDGSDYIGTPATISFLSYNTVQSIPFKITKDDGDTTKRKFTIQLSSPTGGAILGRATASVTILPYAGASLNTELSGVLVNHYPNPVSSSATIVVKGINSDNVWVKVYNPMSQLVALLPANSDKSDKEFTFNAGHLNAGVYTYEVIAEGQSIARKKMVLMPH